MEAALKLLTPDGPNVDLRKIQSRVAPAMRGGCVGTPESVRRQHHRYYDMGIEFFLYNLIPTPEEIHRVRDEIIVPLRGSVTATPAAAAQ